MARNRIEKAVVVGGGLIGLKATEALVERVIKVTVVELADRILSITFDHKAAAMVAGYLKERGVNIITENTVSLIKGDNSKVEKVILKDQREVPCQLLIFAIGVQPNVDLVRGTSIRVNRGIVVNKYLETSVPDIYAAGDVAESFDLVMGI
ncbi:FAD-dependent oxidoreductase, partial [Candidatus Hakubella thermalkaliphila]